MALAWVLEQSLLVLWQYSQTPHFALTAGHEFLALAWVLEQSSRAIAHTLRQIPNPSAAAVVVPDIEGVPSERMYEMFALAVEFAYHGHVELADADVLDLWAVAASLQVAPRRDHVVHQHEFQ